MDDLFNISKLTYHFPILRELSSISQEKKYHAEGDVLTHTQMVLRELINLEEWNSLQNNEKKLLFIATAFHDLGKLSCTKIENGEIVSPKHAAIGSKQFRVFAWKNLMNHVSFTEREKIVNLIRYHGLPIWIFDKKNPKKDLIRCSLVTPLNLLYLLSKADALGRVSVDSDKILYEIDMFKEYALENDCFNKPFRFANNHHKFHFLNIGYQDVGYIPYKEPPFEVVLMSGLPGSGKDFAINKKWSQLPVISLDAIRRELKIAATKNQGKVISIAKEKAKEYLRAKKTFVWNATNITADMRNRLIDLFVLYGASVRIVYVEKEYNVLLEQNMNRKYPVPEKALHKLITKLDVPQAYEAHQVEHLADRII